MILVDYLPQLLLDLGSLSLSPYRDPKQCCYKELVKCTDICIPDIPIWRWSLYSQFGGRMQQWLQHRQDEFRIVNWVEYVVLNLNKVPLVWDCFPNSSIKSVVDSKKRVQRKCLVTSLPGLPASS